MKWPWRRRRSTNGEMANVVRAHAQAQLQRARDRTPHVDETARRARELARRSDWFAREVERAMRLRGTT